MTFSKCNYYNGTDDHKLIHRLNAPHDWPNHIISGHLSSFLIFTPGTMHASNDVYHPPSDMIMHINLSVGNNGSTILYMCKIKLLL